MRVIGLLGLILCVANPGGLDAQQWQCVGQGCPPTQATVQDLLDASRNNGRAGAPGVSLAEGFAQGFQQGQNSALQRQSQLLQIQIQQEQLRQLREQNGQVEPSGRYESEYNQPTQYGLGSRLVDWFANLFRRKKSKPAAIPK